MSHAKVTVLIPNYRTPEVTKLCLRLLRKHTSPEDARVIVIDNDSGDDSLEYLRSLPWIQLIERPRASDDTPPLSHSRALDMALPHVRTPYVLSIHTDTFAVHPDWLQVVLREFEKDSNIAGVGSWKLEPPPSMVKRIGKFLEFRLRIARYMLSGRRADVEKIRAQMGSGYYGLFEKKTADPGSGEGKSYYYLRSHCAMYRYDLLVKYGLTFTGAGKTAGKEIHAKMIREGYRMKFLPSSFLNRYIVHLNHATMILRPELGSSRSNIVKGKRRIRKYLKEIDAERILRDGSLDY